MVETLHHLSGGSFVNSEQLERTGKRSKRASVLTELGKDEGVLVLTYEVLWRRGDAERSL